MPVTTEGQPIPQDTVAALLSAYDGDRAGAARALVRGLIRGETWPASDSPPLAASAAADVAIAAFMVAAGRDETRLLSYADGFADGLADEAERS